MSSADHSETAGPTPAEAQRLLDSIPARPRRVLGAADHLSAAAIILLSFAAGVVALVGHPWWAVIPAAGALVMSHLWLLKRLRRPNEPRLTGTLALTVFAVWLVMPVWRGITRGETVPVPEVFIFAGLAPAAWLIYYVVLLVRR
ncbi:hypothetical protein [Galactobacter sp.]|uniref:hypothetical protein n=1 Tax=Galactobacter sp. TaxID=2676125 RepID=UPI0025C6C9D5|nr:hypothetical protein [Galactobacter sp.]